MKRVYLSMELLLGLILFLFMSTEEANAQTCPGSKTFSYVTYWCEPIPGDLDECRTTSHSATASCFYDDRSGGCAYDMTPWNPDETCTSNPSGIGCNIREKCGPGLPCWGNCGAGGGGSCTYNDYAANNCGTNCNGLGCNANQRCHWDEGDDPALCDPLRQNYRCVNDASCCQWNDDSCGWNNECQTDEMRQTHTPGGCLPATRCVNNPVNCRPPVCSGMSVSPLAICEGTGNSVDITLTGNPPESQIRRFYLGFYNLDNLIGPGNPNPIIFNGTQLVIHTDDIDPCRGQTSCTIPISYDILNHPDENWGNQYPVNIQVNGYFLLEDGGYSLGNPVCTESFEIVPLYTIQGHKGIVSTQVVAGEIPGGGGYFVEDAYVTARTVTDSKSNSDTANPYYLEDICSTGVTNYVSSADIFNYERGYSTCYDEFNCHNSPALITPVPTAPINENSVINNYDPATDGPYPYASTWFHYTPIPRCTISGSARIPVGGSANYSATSTIDIQGSEVVENQVGIYKTPDVINPAVPANTIAGPTPLVTRDCSNSANCTQSYNLNAISMPAGTRFNIYCRAANGSLTSLPGVPASPPALLHECNPFCVTFTGIPCFTGETNPVYRSHPFDANCGSPDVISVLVSEGAWFQTKGGNVVTKGGLSESIPLTATDLNFITDPVGLLIYSSAGTLILGSGTVSSANISAKNEISYNPDSTFGQLYQKLPSNVVTGMTTISDATIDISTLSTCVPVRGYCTFYRDGSLTITNISGNYRIPNSVRILLFVGGNGQTTFDGQIKSLTRGHSSFTLISQGDIIVNSGVGGLLNDGLDPDLEGVFYTDGDFISNTLTPLEDVNLHVRGAVSADLFNLNRDLLADGGADEGNENTPGEFFEYGTEQMMAFPPFLKLRSSSWSEVQP